MKSKTKTLKKPDGRTTIHYTVEEKAAAKQEFLRRLQEGAFATDIYGKDGAPHRMTILAWRAQDAEFDMNYRLSRKLQAEAHAERAIKVALNEDPKFTNHDPTSRRLAFNGLQWSAAHLDPATWGDRVTLAGDAGAPLQITVEKQNVLREMTVEERKSVLATLQGVAARKTIEGEAEEDEGE